MDYTFKKSKKARNLTIKVHMDGAVVVTMPSKAPEAFVAEVLKKKEPWIRSTQERLKSRFSGKIALKQTPADYQIHKEKAREIITARVEHFNTFYQFKYKKISIRNQKSRWGSCSIRGNLNFNYGLIKLPQELLDYVIVHELAHLKEMNHSQRFWNVVAQAIPDYKERRKVLRNNYIQIS